MRRGPLCPTNEMSWPNLVHGSFQKLMLEPSPGSIWNHCSVVCLSSRIFLNSQVWFCLGFMCQKLSSFITLSRIQAAHIDSVLNSRSQRSFIVQVLFHNSRLRSPKPPCCFGRVTVSQATLATYLPSKVPFQRNALHILSID